jgi:hypothetical protein
MYDEFYNHFLHVETQLKLELNNVTIEIELDA